MSKSNKKSMKAQLLSLPGLKFLDEVDSELKKVTWPTREQTTRLTIIVMVVSLAFGLYLGGLDYVFTWLVGEILKVNI